MTIQQFRTIVWKHYKAHGRHSLPWRATTDPYRILLSEVMLQQTQVERVIPYYRSWMKVYPTPRRLAGASLADVLTHWQGLGYNRRAKMLHEAAKAIVRDYDGKMPKSVEELESLPGIGPYTARAVAAFAHNQDVIFIETNIRTAIIHHFFRARKIVDDTEIQKILEKAFPKGKSREWYAALMDYGASLKRSGIRLNDKSKGHMRQSAFKGSGREVRGAILRELARGSASRAKLLSILGPARKEQATEQLEKLHREGMICKEGRSYSLPA
ncbi:MAG: A/G-specific adenine glycosylase [Patescibacteria group bacterium]